MEEDQIDDKSDQYQSYQDQHGKKIKDNNQIAKYPTRINMKIQMIKDNNIKWIVLPRKLSYWLLNSKQINVYIHIQIDMTIIVNCEIKDN